MTLRALDTQIDTPAQNVPVAECRLPEAPPISAPIDKSSYAEILRSSAVIGGAQAINILIGIGRTKAMAMFLGPSGFGLAGLYGSIVDLAQNIGGVGVNSSGVRQIAEAVGSNRADRIWITATVLRRTSIMLGVISALGLIVFSRQISFLTFGNNRYATAIALLSVAAFCKVLSGAQSALIQGLRRVTDLAKINMMGALVGAVAGVAVVYEFREKGIVAYVIGVAGGSLITSWWYSRQVKIGKVKERLTILQIGSEVSTLLKLGIAFMISSLISLGVGYVTRVIVLQKIGILGTGLFQAAWTLGGIYVGFILQAMGADFYPRLTASISDQRICNRLVNEQARVGLLLAGPGVIATLTFAPAVIALFYTGKFAASVPILRWICLGATLQVLTWPVGFVIVAKGRQDFFLISEISWAVVSLALAWICIQQFGLAGAGIAFFGSYIFHGLVTYAIARHLTGFRWSTETMITALVFLALIFAVFAISYTVPTVLAMSIGLVMSVATAAYSTRVLVSHLGRDRLPQPIRKLLARGVL